VGLGYLYEIQESLSFSYSRGSANLRVGNPVQCSRWCWGFVGCSGSGLASSHLFSSFLTHLSPFLFPTREINKIKSSVSELRVCIHNMKKTPSHPIPSHSNPRHRHIYLKHISHPHVMLESHVDVDCYRYREMMGLGSGRRTVDC